MTASRTQKRRLLMKSCTVPACGALLTLDDPPYAYRYSVCNTHLRAPSASLVGGLKRFCQKCSCWHALTAFDGLKRSCRKRLLIQRNRIRSKRPKSLAKKSPPAPPLPHVSAALFEHLAAVFRGDASDEVSPSPDQHTQAARPHRARLPDSWSALGSAPPSPPSSL